jgi:hypothetical protein
LTGIECNDNGATLLVAVNGTMTKFHTSSPHQIVFRTVTSDALPGPIGCGPIPGSGKPAIIYYRTASSSGSAGEPLAVEFVER